MTPEDLDQIELSLSLALPVAYRQIMTAYPFPADSPAAELWVLNEVDSDARTNAGGSSGFVPDDVIA
jgi:hypothetical protein